MITQGSISNDHVVNGEIVLSTGELQRRLGVGASVKFLQRAGVAPLVHTKRATYWRASDFPLICRAIAHHMDRLADGRICE